MWTRGEGVQNPANFADVLYVWSLCKYDVGAAGVCVGPEIKFGYIRENGLPPSHFMWPWRGAAVCAACCVCVCVTESNEVVAAGGNAEGGRGEFIANSCGMKREERRMGWRERIAAGMATIHVGCPLSLGNFSPRTIS